jgi:tetratricopeptide (TPR) repeat protein
VIAGCATLAWAAAPVEAQVAAAEALFNQGRQLMEEKKYAEACEKFQRSHELDPSVGALGSLGDCREKNGQIASAWAAYSEAVSLARQRNDKRRERAAQDHVKRLERLLSYLVLEVPAEARVNGLTITRNGEPVPDAVWNEKVPVDPGRYVIRVEAPGHRSAELSVEVGPRSDEARAAVPVLEPASQTDTSGGSETGSSQGAGEAAGGTTTTAPVDGGGMPMERKIAIGVAGGGVLVIGVGAIFGVRASGLWDDAKSHCVNGDFDNCDPEGVSLGNDARSSANLATVAFSVGVAAVAAGAVLWFLNPPSAQDEAERAARIEPILSPDSVGARLELRF